MSDPRCAFTACMKCVARPICLFIWNANETRRGTGSCLESAQSFGWRKTIKAWLYLRRYSQSLQAGRSGDRIPAGAKFSALIQTVRRSHPASYKMGTESVSPGVTRSGRGVNFLPPSSTKVKERVELHLLSPSVPYWQVIGWTLPLLPIALTNSCCCLVRWCSGTFAELYSRGAQFDPRLGTRLIWMRVLVVFFGPSKPRSFVSNFRQTCCAVDRYVTQTFWSKVSWERV